MAVLPNDFDHPADLGLDDYFGLMSGGIRDYYNWTAVENGRQVSVDGYSTTVLTDRAVIGYSKNQSGTSHGFSGSPITPPYALSSSARPPAFGWRSAG